MLEKEDRTFIKHMKGLFNPAQLAEIRQHYQTIENAQPTDGITERERQALLRGESTDQLRMLTDWYAVWRNPELADILNPYTLVTYPVQVRHVKAMNHHVPWHQDIGYMKLLGDRAPKQVITCFIPLEAEPAKCTTIQFATLADGGEKKDLAHVARDGFGAGIDTENFNRTFHFDLSLGDALVFGDHVVHRTYLPEGCQVNRRSLEFRLIMPEHAVIGRDCFDICAQKFIKIGESQQREVSTIE
jgi:hypothetical protein